uniref:Uncharacterized protein n=1 Tax=Kryptolebias marmoratus TaxID=37003 RepID=A0A3Q3A761_KRYMA
MISVQRGGRRAVLSETPAGPARGPSLCCGEGGRRHRGPELQALFRRGFPGRREAVLWAPRAEDGAPGVPASWSVAERREGLQKRLHWKRFGGGLRARRGFCHRTRTAAGDFPGAQRGGVRRQSQHFRCPPSRQ